MEDMKNAAQPCERVTVALLPQAAADLAALRDRTGLSKTDITNRGISLYELVDSRQRAGCDLVLRDRQTGETQLVRFL